MTHLLAWLRGRADLHQMALADRADHDAAMELREQLGSLRRLMTSEEGCAADAVERVLAAAEAKLTPPLLRARCA